MENGLRFQHRFRVSFVSHASGFDSLFVQLRIFDGAAALVLPMPALFVSHRHRPEPVWYKPGNGGVTSAAMDSISTRLDSSSNSSEDLSLSGFLPSHGRSSTAVTCIASDGDSPGHTAFALRSYNRNSHRVRTRPRNRANALPTACVAVGSNRETPCRKQRQLEKTGIRSRP
ncbi:hypothetical protein SEMRO_1903_G304511.1 [Seminavis robusta]|uniref:Uncharacterized protein n=1 Tax=Seminavis robusta TaxID=568900 RepID=A0A9N8EWJ7_9STRA|nr:hypothetical protein SEMRO_1903_G304511.1 [Seminavis robusta]|eukprot:Sro1903_g304511.1  (172) ;mRNA; r:10054-10569